MIIYTVRGTILYIYTTIIMMTPPLKAIALSLLTFRMQISIILIDIDFENYFKVKPNE